MNKQLLQRQKKVKAVSFSISPGLNTEFSERLENCMKGVEYTNQDIEIFVIMQMFTYTNWKEILAW